MTATTNKTSPDLADRSALLARAESLKLHGLIEHWDELDDSHRCSVNDLLGWEESVRCQRGLERRIGSAHLGKFKPLADFDWQWPRDCDKGVVSEWMKLGFMSKATNLILLGPNGVGKSTIAQNLAHRGTYKGDRRNNGSRTDLWGRGS